MRFHGISGPVAFDLRIDYVVFVPSAAPRPFDVDVIGYSYRMLERSGRELLAFHWHPVGLSRVVTPHLHLSSRLRPIPIEPVGLTISLADHHIPTGIVTLADVVRYLIVEIGIEPRRSDWREVLASASD